MIRQRWLRVPLASPSHIDGAFALGYRITGGVDDAWSVRFNSFKFGPPQARTAGITVIRAVLPSLIREIFAGTTMNAQRVTFVPALGSRETTADPNGAIAILAQSCARVFDNPVRLDLLTKSPHESLHQSGAGADVRAEIVRNAGYRAGAVEADVVVVFDDFITRGDTLGRIADSIKVATPNVRVYGVALAKNQGVDYLDPATANAHLVPELADLWDQQVGR